MLVNFKNEKVVYLVRVKDLGGYPGRQKDKYDHKCQSKNLQGSHDYVVVVVTVLVWDPQEEYSKKKHHQGCSAEEHYVG